MIARLRRDGRCCSHRSTATSTARSSFESEQVWQRLDELAPSGASIAAIVEGAPGLRRHDPRARGESPASSRYRRARAQTARWSAIGVELARNLSDGEEEDAADAVEATLRGIDAPRGARRRRAARSTEEFSERAEKDAERAELISLPIALVVMAIVFGGIVAAGMPLAIAFAGVFVDDDRARRRRVGHRRVALRAERRDHARHRARHRLRTAHGQPVPRGARRRLRDPRRGTPNHGEQRPHRSCSPRPPSRLRLSSLFVFEDATMRSLGIAGITVVLACMAAALTLMPALLGRFGHRLGVAEPAVGSRLVRARRPADPTARRRSSPSS